MSDLIDRQAAIEALKQQAETMSEWSNRYAEQRKGILTAVNIVEDLPPAQLGTNLAEVGTDCISRQQAIDAVYKCSDIFVGDMPVMVVKADAYEALAQLPSAQPERKMGKWIYKTDLITAPTGYWECSECKEGRLLYEENFCPHCGADMREVTE